MKCVGCQKTLEVGDRYIEDAASGFIGKDASEAYDGLMADIFGGAGGKVFYCEDCTEPGGEYMFETVWSDDAR